MGVNFKQYAIIGFSLDAEDCLVRESDAIYEEQNRYDIKTGKKTGIEKVLVKQAVEYYRYKNIKNECYNSFIEQVADFLGLDYFEDEGAAVIGIKLQCNTNDYTFNALEGDYSLEEIESKMEKVKEKADLDWDEIKLHFLYYVG